MKSSLSSKTPIYKNFSLTHSSTISEIHCDLQEIIHHPTSAKVIHIANDDPDNLFCIALQTIPQDSKGAAHILEHTVLCGSKKYPVKDPFFSMLRRSLNTFMNAFTGPDFTCYPASSQVEKDFYNLLDVYLDAVFFPELKKNSFLQEGHRLEFTQDKLSSLLCFQGVVYNEMKGAVSSADDRLWHTLMEKLYPDITYRYDSGGDPKEIVKLSYEELLQFHSRFYHPSHALFFFYGNLPIEKHLDFIEEKVLHHFGSIPPLPPIQTQQPFLQPIHYSSSYPIEKHTPLAKKSLISFGFSTCPITDQKTLLSLMLLDLILMDTDASPLKKAFLDSPYCSHVDSDLQSEMSQVPWVFIFKGCDPANKIPLFNLMKNSLTELIKKPLPSDLIEGALHQMEFSRSEIGEEGHPFGLSLFMTSSLPALHGCQPEDGIKIHSLIQSIREELKNPRFFSSLIESYLLNNTHLVLLDMQPDPNLEQQEENEEKETLSKILLSLSDQKKQGILEQTQRLKDYQEKQENQSLDCLPILHIEDVPKEVKKYPLHIEQKNNLSIYHFPSFTNKIIYLDLLFPLPDLSEFELPFLSFFSSLLPEIGSANRSFEDNLKEIQNSLGDLSTHLSLYRNIHHPDSYTPMFAVKGKSLTRNAHKLFSLVKDLLLSPNLTDKKRILQLLDQHYTLLQDALSHQALKYASLMATSGVDLPSAIQNQFFGLPFFEWITKQKKDPSQLLFSLNAIREKMLSWKTLDLVLSCDEEDFQFVKNQNNFFSFPDLPSFAPDLWKPRTDVHLVSSQGRLISSPVFFTSQAYKTIGYLHQDAPCLLLTAYLMDHLILHKKIREQGGAYGAGANFTSLLSVFSFFSYRDPHLMSSYTVFDEAIDLLALGDFTEESLHEAKLSAIQGMDAPILPGQKAIAAYVRKKTGRTLPIQMAFRERLLSATKKEIQQAVATHLLPLKGKGANIAFGSKEIFEKEKFPYEILPI